MRELFRGKHKEDGVIVPAGRAATRKGEFAEALAGQLRDARYNAGDPVHVPAPLRRVFDFLYPAPPALPHEPTPGARRSRMTSMLAHAGTIDDLTEEQRMAAATSTRNVFIEAEPGAGKTTVSAQRLGVAAYLQGDTPVAPRGPAPS